MKKKIIYLIVIVSMVLTIGLFSIKKTYARDYNVQEYWGNQNLFCAFSPNMAYVEGIYFGSQMSLETGNNLQELSINLDSYCAYLFTDEVSGYDTLLINFYYDNVNNRTAIQYGIFEEGQLYSIQYDYLTYQQILLVFFSPGSNGIDNNKVVTIKCALNTTQDHLSLQHVSDTILTMVDENYYLGNYSYQTMFQRSFNAFNMLLSYGNPPLISQFNYSGEAFVNYFNLNRLDVIFTPQLNQFINLYSEAAYSRGYDEGLLSGDYSSGYQNGLQIGRQLGYSLGYDDGYEDGENGENAIHPFWSIITDIGTAITSILSINLGPGITIGTLIFIPLFFAVLGLVLWIWRHN